METISQTSERQMSTTEIRELAFRDLEKSLATIKEGAVCLGDKNPIVLRMVGAIGVAENSLKIIAMTPASEIRALSGPLHGEPDASDFAADAIPVETESTTTETERNGNGAERNGNGTSENGAASENGAGTSVETDEKKPAAYAVAHAKVKHRCGAHDLGCAHPRISGNSHGRHQQLCPFFQTGRLIEAGYDIHTLDDYAKALKKEHKKLPYSSVEAMQKAIDLEHGSYRKVLLAVRKGLKARAKKAESRTKKSA